MSQHRRRPSVESLEVRTYAAKITYASDAAFFDNLLGLAGAGPHSSEAQTAARNSRKPAAVIRTLAQSQAEPRQYITPYLDKNGTLYLRGTFGDDTVQARAVGNGVLRISYGSVQNFTYLKSELDARPPESRIKYTPVPGSSGLVVVTSLSGNTIEVKAADVRRIVIDGRDGVDTVRVKGLPVIPVTFDVESATVVQTKAPAGLTPSDPVRSGKYRRGAGWDEIITAERAAAAASRATTAFFGDSHASLFPRVGRVAWQGNFARSIAFGIGGDGTRQLLTRIRDGVFDSFKPKTLVVSVGHNNFNDPAAGGTDEQIYQGVLAVAAALRQKLPGTRLVFVGLLPRENAVVNDRVRVVNARLSDTADTHGFDYLDLHARFGDNTLDPQLVSPSSHFTAKGYRVLASLITAALRGE